MEIKSKYLTSDGDLIIEKESLSVSPLSSLSTSPLPTNYSQSIHQENYLSKKVSVQNFKM